MAWRGGYQFFDPVARALDGAPDGLKLKVCTELVEALLRGGWDTSEGTWIEGFEDDEIVIQAFRANGVYREYCMDRRDEDTWEYCRREAGHLDDHRTRDGITWPQASDLRFGPLTEIETLREQIRVIRESATRWTKRRNDYGNGDHRYWQGMRDAGDAILHACPDGPS